ncbi:hypothetical protein DFJ43DRAFT_502703 [Lentinula guzmanii]|uniref:Uncharacterized protein n=1 Tax=Lentinula guzmanii TaxID=2804957 RepID=A0AA38JGQ3_9AGAR|nr:hypothetical protein DFJ43DRAFT_502703 [Lentinula guzmanii]
MWNFRVHAMCNLSTRPYVAVQNIRTFLVSCFSDMLSTGSPLRQSVSCSSRVFRRYSSQKGKQPAPHALSQQKMRALISLYHQSNTFITPENLSERIDQAFTMKKKGDLAFGPLKAGVDTLSHFYTQAKLAPKFSEWDREKMRFGDGVWSKAAHSRREWKVIEALYGVDASGLLDPMPGLEVLDEGEEAKIGLPLQEVIMEDDVIDERTLRNDSHTSNKSQARP